MCMRRWRLRRFNTVNTGLSTVEAVSESECLMKKLHLNEANLSPRETFKVMIDSLLAELEKRIKA